MGKSQTESPLKLKQYVFHKKLDNDDRHDPVKQVSARGNRY